MDVYSCRVRLKGNLLHTVVKEQVTAAEIMLLEHIHQGDNPAVYDIQKIGEAKRADRRERDRLAMLYGEMLGRSGVQVVAEVLGVSSVPLPQSLGDEFQERIVDDNGIAKAAELARKPSGDIDAMVETNLLDDAEPAEKPIPVARRTPRTEQPAA